MIIATFPKGVTAMTVNGLHQWDYGQQLQVSAEGLPALVEVHFACPGMAEAIVRTCSAVSGAATAAIPDKCLEQTAPVTAWVYLVDETSGTTALELTLPITARTRPQAVPDMPQVVVDRYNELIAAANEAIVEVAASAAQAKNAASSASSSASAASNSVTQAKNAASSASASASSAGGYASAASSSASSASASASSASSSASAANEALQQVKDALRTNVPTIAASLPTAGYYYIEGYLNSTDGGFPTFFISFGLVYWGGEGTFADASCTSVCHYALSISSDGTLSYRRYSLNGDVMADNQNTTLKLGGFKISRIFDYN